VDGADGGAIDLPAQLVGALGGHDALAQLALEIVGGLLCEGDGGDLAELAALRATRHLVAGCRVGPIAGRFEFQAE